MRQAIGVLLLGAGIGVAMPASAAATVISWAGTGVQTVPTIVNPGGAVGAPDASPLAAGTDFNLAAVSNGGGTGTWGSFGSGVAYDTASLEALLGVPLGAVDFLAIEYNGSAGIGFEGSQWLFSDGVDSFAITHIEGTTQLGIVANVGVTPSAYATFFGLDPFTGGEFAFLLFDLPSSVDTLSAGFTVQVSKGSGVDGGTPDIDAMGVLVPEPGTLALLGLGLLALTARRMRRS